MELKAGALDAPAPFVRVVGGRAHHIDAARDHDLAESGPDLHRRVQDRLEAGPAAPVDLRAGDRFGKSGVKGGDPADGRGLGGRIGVAEDDLIDLAGVDAGTGDDLGDDVRGECGRLLLGEHPAEAADGGTQRFADDDIGLVGHGRAFRGSVHEGRDRVDRGTGRPSHPATEPVQYLVRARSRRYAS